MELTQSGLTAAVLLSMACMIQRSVLSVLAYYAVAVSSMHKMFTILAPGVNLTKTFSSSLTKRPNKLDRLSMTTVSGPWGQCYKTFLSVIYEFVINS